MKCEKCGQEQRQWDVEPFDVVYEGPDGVYYVAKVYSEDDETYFIDRDGKDYLCKSIATPLPRYNLINLSPERCAELREWLEKGCPEGWPGGDSHLWYRYVLEIFPELQGTGCYPCNKYGEATIRYVAQKLLEHNERKPEPEFKPYAAVRIAENYRTIPYAPGTVIKVEAKSTSYMMRDSNDREHYVSHIATIANPAEAHAILHDLGYGGKPDAVEQIQTYSTMYQRMTQIKGTVSTEFLLGFSQGFKDALTMCIETKKKEEKLGL